jgi:hypothetical protein
MPEWSNGTDLNPHSHKAGKQMRHELLLIESGLNGLYKMLTDINELEKKVHELLDSHM